MICVRWLTFVARALSHAPYLSTHLSYFLSVNKIILTLICLCFCRPRLTSNRWERYLARFVAMYDAAVGDQLEAAGYTAVDAPTRAWVLKILLEAQLDANARVMSLSFENLETLCLSVCQPVCGSVATCLLSKHVFPSKDKLSLCLSLSLSIDSLS